MGAACVRPIEEVEYFGPPDRPRTVPTDLKVWKRALAEREKTKQEQLPVTTASNSSNNAPSVPPNDILLTPGGTRIQKMKDGSDETTPAQPQETAANNEVAVI